MHISTSRFTKLLAHMAWLSMALSLAIPGVFAATASEDQKATGQVAFYNGDASAECRVTFQHLSLGFDQNKSLVPLCNIRNPRTIQLHGLQSASKITFEGRLMEGGLHCLPAAGDNGPLLYKITIKIRSDNTSSPAWSLFDLLPVARTGMMLAPNIEVTEVQKSGDVPSQDYVRFLNCIRLKDGNTPN